MRNVCILILFMGLNSSCNARVPEDNIERSHKIYEWVREYEFGKIIAEFDSSLGSRVDSVKLASAWTNLTDRVGAFVKVTDTYTEKDGQFDVVIQKSVFEKRNVDFKLIYDEKGKVKGIFFVPEVKKVVFDDPGYLDTSKYFDKRTYVTTGMYRLPAMITMPKDHVKPPLVILVHGSGPNDKDETVGATKIFRDIAVGLAAQGIAVLRYDKRTRNYAGRMKEDSNKLTVKEEVMDDVLSAIRMMRKDSTIDHSRIYLVGHSLGGMLLPRIVAQSNDVMGLVMLAANARPMEILMLEQAEYLTEGDSSQEVKEVLDSLRNGISMINLLTASNSSDTTGILGIPVSYWLDLKTYDPVQAATKLKIPMLVLHGDRDYQVNNTDFSMWKNGLRNSKNVMFKSYPKLNHFFITGEEKSMPQEYDEPGNVEEQVIEDIASFINNAKLK
jgi:dienelactone hydrolase